MGYAFLDTLATPSVRAAQEANGVGALWQEAGADRDFVRLGPAEAAFIAARDSFYLASVSENGWPYLQHRGGPRGFLKVLDAKTLAFADFRGNRQYISLGNIAADDRVCLFLMDYPNRARLKVLAHMQAVGLPDHPDLAERLTTPGYRGKVERAMVLRLEAFDWNCAQHITPRFTIEETLAAVAPLRSRVTELEAEVARLRAGAA